MKRAPRAGAGGPPRSAKSLAASRRTGWLGKNQRRRICYEPEGSFRFFGRTTLFHGNYLTSPKNRPVSYLKSILAGVRPNFFSRFQNLSSFVPKRQKRAKSRLSFLYFRKDFETRFATLQLPRVPTLSLCLTSNR